VRFFIFAIFMLLLAGCGEIQPTSSKAPEWVTSVSPIYRGSRYMVGMGSGATHIGAGDRARAELIKTFAVTVGSSEYGRVEMGGDGYTGSFSDTVYARASMTIEGVEIAERWYDEENDLHYALAVLDKERSAARLRSIVESRNIDIDTLYNNAKREKDTLIKLKTLNSAIKLLGEQRTDSTMLAVLEERANLSYANTLQIHIDRRNVLHSIKVFIDADGEAKRLLLHALELTISSREDADYVITAALKTSSARRNGWDWASAVMDVSLIDMKSQAVRKSAMFEGKDTARQESVAIERSIKKLQAELDAKLLDTVFE
jgi:hypothetical protein